MKYAYILEIDLKIYYAYHNIKNFERQIQRRVDMYSTYTITCINFISHPHLLFLVKLYKIALWCNQQNNNFPKFLNLCMIK